MECGVQGIGQLHTHQQQDSVPGHAERGEEEDFTSSRQEDNSRTGARDSISSSGKSHSGEHLREF